MQGAYCAFLFRIIFKGVVDDKAEHDPGPCGMLSRLINKDLQPGERDIIRVYIM